nr:phosphorylase [bacterium]
KKAYRDEGTSYHYAPASDFIDIKNYKVVEDVCKKYNLDYILGYTWTTDSIYRETVDNIDRRKSMGCICVEMETSALEAMCDFKGLNLYTFFLSGDILVDEWNRSDLGTEKEHKKQLSSFDVAILIAQNI